ncbi:putative transmembrane protein TMEM64 [Helianthus annuus]|nr:putative transmembrane protein TMEM64 [Helianthus annuus]
MKLKVSFAFTWSSAVRASVLLLLLVAFGFACYSLPVEKDEEDFVVMFIGCMYRFGDKFGEIGSRLCMIASFSWL